MIGTQLALKKMIKMSDGEKLAGNLTVPWVVYPFGPHADGMGLRSGHFAATQILAFLPLNDRIA